MMPRPWPASSLKPTSWTTIFWTPGGEALTLSTVSRCVGACSAIGSVRAGMTDSSAFNRCQLCRAATKPLQLAMARSTGASARALRIDPAMMMPAVAS